MTYDVIVISGDQVMVGGSTRKVRMNFSNNTIISNGIRLEPENMTKFFRTAQLIADGELDPGGPIYVE